MKHKETFYLIAVLIVIAVLVCSCSAQKKSIHEENKEEQVEQYEHKANDESIFEYRLDTTKINETEILINRVEFYPAYFDSIARNYTQSVKTIETKKVSKTKKDNGTTEIKAEEKKTDTINVVKEERKKENYSKETEKKEAAVDWWLLVVIFVVGFCVIRWMKS